MSLQLLAKKINLYKPKLSKDAMQDLKKYVQLLDVAQVNDVLDALFTMGHSFDELQLKQALQKITHNDAKFDPLSICTFHSCLENGAYQTVNEVQRKITHASQMLAKATQSLDTLKKLVKFQWNLDIDYVSSIQQQNIVVEPSMPLVPVQSIVQQLTNIQSLSTAENYPGKLVCAVCVLMNQNQVCDQQCILDFVEDKNVANPSSFVGVFSVVVTVGYYLSGKFHTVLLAPPLFVPPERTNLVRVPLGEDPAFLVVNDLQSPQNLSRLQLIVKSVQPAFVLFANNYLVNQNLDPESQALKRLQIFTNSATEIMTSLECPCFFICNESISATPASTFEQIPLSMENVKVLPSVFWFSFGNTRIAVQSR